MHPLRRFRGFTALLFLFFLAACGTRGDIPMVYAGVTGELSKEQKQALIAAAAASQYRPSSKWLDEALQQQDIEKVYVDYAIATIYYAPIAVSDTRTFKPIVLCAWETDPLVWNHCQDESHTVANLPERGSIVISEKITDKELQNILAFIEAAELRSPKGSPILAENVHKVVYYGGIKAFRVFITTPAEESGTVFLRSLSDDRLEPYEITDFVCN